MGKIGHGNLGRIVAILVILAAADQGYVARETLRLGLRAYVGLNTADFRKVDSVPTGRLENHLDIKFENTGSTPAFNTSMKVTVKIVSGGQSLPPDFKSIEEYSTPATSGPNDKGIIIPHVPVAFFDGIKGDLLENARRGDISLYGYGHVSYNDVFEKRHTTLCCVRYHWKADTFQLCPKHNEQYDGDYASPGIAISCKV